MVRVLAVGGDTRPKQITNGHGFVNFAAADPCYQNTINVAILVGNVMPRPEGKTSTSIDEQTKIIKG